jgi:hypothetical protein
MGRELARLLHVLLGAALDVLGVRHGAQLGLPGRRQVFLQPGQLLLQGGLLALLRGLYRGINLVCCLLGRLGLHRRLFGFGLLLLVFGHACTPFTGNTVLWPFAPCAGPRREYGG